MFHTLAFFRNQAAAAEDTQLNAVADQYYNRQNNNFQIPKETMLLGAAVAGASLTRARINTASLRLKGFPQIPQLNVGTEFGNLPGMMDSRELPVMLRMEEDFQIDTSNNDAGAVDHFAIALVSDRGFSMNINHRDCRWIRFTATVTAVDNEWSAPASVAFQDTLEGGRYAIYGMYAQSTNLIAARLQLQDQYERPGCLGVQSLANRTHDMFYGGLGLWGFFNTYTTPQIQTLEDAAGASTIEGKLYVAKAN